MTTTRLYKPSLPGLVQDSNIAVMTRRLSGNLVILDCDDWDVFERVQGILDAADISAWLRNGVTASLLSGTPAICRDPVEGGERRRSAVEALLGDGSALIEAVICTVECVLHVRHIEEEKLYTQHKKRSPLAAEQTSALPPDW